MRLPVLDSQRVNTRPIDTPYENDPGYSGLAEIGKSVQVAGAAVNRVWQQAVVKNATDGLTEFEQAAQKRLRDKDTGIFNLHGEDVVAVGEDLFDKLEVQRQQIRAKLSTPEARKLFDQKTQHAMTGMRGQVQTHIARESQAANVASLKSLQSTTLDSLANATSEDEVERLIDQVKGPIKALALSGEQANGDSQRWDKVAVATVLDSMVARQDIDSARKFYGKNKTRLGDMADTVGRKIESAGIKIDADRFLNLSIDQAKQGINDWPNTDDVIDAAEALEPGPMKDEAVRRARSWALLEDRRQKHEIIGVKKKLFEQWLHGHNRGDMDQERLGWLMETDSYEYEELDKRIRSYEDNLERKAIRNENLAHKRKAWKKAEQKENDKFETPDQAKNMFDLRADMVDLPDKYLAMDTDEFEDAFRGKLSPDRYEDAKDLFIKLKQRAANSADLNLGEFSATVRGGAAKRGVRGKTEAKHFSGLMGTWLNDWYLNHKMPPTAQDVEQGMDWARGKVKTEGFFGTSEEPRHEAVSSGATIVNDPQPTPPVGRQNNKQMRMMQLIREGKSNAEIKAVLDAEGY